MKAIHKRLRALEEQQAAAARPKEPEPLSDEESAARLVQLFRAGVLTCRDGEFVTTPSAGDDWQWVADILNQALDQAEPGTAYVPLSKAEAEQAIAYIDAGQFSMRQADRGNGKGGYGPAGDYFVGAPFGTEQGAFDLASDVETALTVFAGQGWERPQDLEGLRFWLAVTANGTEAKGGEDGG